MAKQKETKNQMLTIKHVDSGHVEEMTTERYDALKPQIRAKYSVTNRKDIIDAPQEVAEKAATKKD